MPSPVIPAEVRDPLSNDPFKEGLPRYSLPLMQQLLNWMLFGPRQGERPARDVSPPVSWKPSQAPEFLNANYGKSDSSVLRVTGLHDTGVTERVGGMTGRCGPGSEHHHVLALGQPPISLGGF